MKRAALFASALLGWSCSESAPDSMQLVATANSTQQVAEVQWITLGIDALKTAQAAADTQTAGGTIHPVLMDDEIAVLDYQKEHIAKLSELMHDRHGRCGGFMVHESFEMAKQAVETKAHLRQSLAAPVDYTIDNASVVHALLPAVAKDEITSSIEALSSFQTRYYLSSTAVDAAEWLQALWTQYANGRDDVTVELIHHSDYPMPSVMLTIQGASLPDEVVVIGGHLDSINSFVFDKVAPGADDNASGIASLSEALRVALSAGYKPDRTVKMIGYAAEEVGLRGSQEIANDFAARNINVVGVLQLDMTNYQGSTTDIWIVEDYTNAAQNQFLRNLVDTYLPDVTWANSQCGYACSDHASWTQAGYPASHPFEAKSGEQNQHIHTRNDTLAQSGGDSEHAEKFARLTVAYLAELAKGGLECVDCAVCGDNECNGDETCESCSVDCGSCTVECSHDKCEQGRSLVPDCDPCVSTICAQDPYCCETLWDRICVEQVTSVCRETCSVELARSSR